MHTVLQRMILGLLCISPFLLNAQLFEKLIGDEEEGWAAARVLSVMTYPDGGTLVYLGSEGMRSLMKLDAGGEPVWRRTAPGNYVETVPGLNGSAYLVQTNYSGNEPSHCIIKKIDADGEYLWSKSYQMQISTISNPIQRAYAFSREEGGLDIFLVGDNWNSDSSYIMRIDADGNVEWTRGSPNSLPMDVVNHIPQIIQDGNNGIFVFYPFQNGYAGSMSRFDGQGDLLWSRSVRMTNALWVYHDAGMAVTPDGDVYVCGSQWVGNGYYNYLFKMDQQGELEWYKRYGDGNDPLQTIFYGMYSNGNLSFGYRSRLVFDLAGEMLSRSMLQGQTWQDGSFEYSIIHNTMMPVDPTHHIQYGSLQRRDALFDFTWSTPLVMRVPYDIGNCLLEPIVYGTMEDTIVPPAYLEVLDHVAWSDISVTVLDSLPQSFVLPFPGMVDPCLSVGIEEEKEELPQLLVKPSIIDPGSPCSVELRTEGSIELYDPSGRALYREGRISKFHDLTTHNLSAGVYLLRAIDPKGMTLGVSRIVVR